MNRNSKKLTAWLSAGLMLGAGIAVAVLSADRVHAAGPDGSVFLVTANHTVSGMVVDANGSPAGGITVKLLKAGAGKSGPAVRGPNDSPTGDASIGTPDANQLQAKQNRNEAVVKEMKTDTAGKFSFADIPMGRYSLLADADKRSVKQELIVKDGPDPAPVTLKLLKG